MKQFKLAIWAGALAAAFLAPGIASADFVLDTGAPVTTLSTTQFLAAEFAATAGESITSLSAYLTEGAGNVGDTFVFDIYSSASFTGRATGRVLDYTATGTFTANGWNTTSANWTPTTTGDYWLALQVSSTTQTKGLSAPGAGISTASGTAPALAFAFAGTNGQYALSSAAPVALEISTAPVPLPAAVWLLGSGLAGLATWRRRRSPASARI